ncbi:OmpA family protein [Eubacteriales bacterium OttesenSCG-928-N13]|nr:OmpA family protein [Eubacteriales bacterium OttesenSCG-928-N13]
MRSNSLRRRSRHKSNENYSFWLSFSDLMSALLMVFILILFYSMYQHFDMLEVKTAELLRQSGLLDQQVQETEAQKAAAEQQRQENEQAQAKLTESEKLLIAEQAKLLLSQQAQEETQKTLAERQKDLDDALSLLEMQQEDLATARSLLETQQAKLQDQQVRLDALVGVRARIVQSLAQALNTANVRAKVDETTGSIALDASVLFDVGKSELKDEGKRVLDQFVPVYLSVLMNSENQANISEIIIEGHTDSQGTYMNNLWLSQERAFSVMEYILSDENTNISAQMKTRLRQIATANGRSFSNVLLNADGTENAEASRRVEFKFRMQDEQMIESMRDILDGMQDVTE